MILACFNHGRKGQPDQSLNQFLLKAFESTLDGSRVWGSMYHWNHRSFTKDLDDLAIKKNLHLLLLAGRAESKAPKAVRDFFKRVPYGGWWKRNPYGRRNHTKFFLFERSGLFPLQKVTGKLVHPLGFSSDPNEFSPPPQPYETSPFLSTPTKLHPGIIPQLTGPALYLSSANITDEAEEKHNFGIITPISLDMMQELVQLHADIPLDYFNDLYLGYSYIPLVLQALYAGDPKRAQRLIFAAIRSKKDRYQRQGNEGHRPIDCGHCKLYFFPRVPKRDTLVGVLKNIQHYSNPSASGPCEIRIVIPRFRSSRIAVAHCLERLHHNGASISIVTRSSKSTFGGPTGDEEPELSHDVASILSQCATRHFQSKGVNIHSKYLLVNAPYKQSDGTYRQERLVWFGTGNFTGDAIDKNFELLLKLKHDSGAYEPCLANFNDLIKNYTDSGRPPGVP